MRTVRKPYQMYVLNLDALRIFWITIILFLLLFLTFVVGYFIGKEKAKSDITKLTKKNNAIMNDILKNVNQNKGNKQDDDYEFYELMNGTQKNNQTDIKKPTTDNIDDDLNIDDNPVKKEISQPTPVPIQKNIPAKKRFIPNKKLKSKSTYLIEFGDKKLSKRRPYTIQIASYRSYKNALLLYNLLKKQQFPAYIIRSKVNHLVYYRIRVGAFPSKTLSLKVLAMIKRLKGCEDSYITTK